MAKKKAENEEKIEDREAALEALKKESEKDIREKIKALLALPMNKRTHFLRVKHPDGGSHL